MAWDREFYDRLTGKYNYADVIKKGIELFGNIDIYGLWTSWPLLGLDQRNQWEMYSNLPGGTEQIRSFVKVSQQAGTKFFIAYNPWDESNQAEDHFKGLAKLISETDADGVILDTRSKSSSELQSVADSVRKGVVMYSEGMAVAMDMPGIISGRVHNAIYYSPELNLNRLMKPDFSIFRVCDVGEDVIHREIAVSFFNGYGTELNMFRPGGRGDSYRDDLAFLARTTFILRQNNDSFLDYNWTPLHWTTTDKVYVNRWKSGNKILYTILNMREKGVAGKLFNIELSGDKHYVSLWNHENIMPVTENGKTFIPVNIDGWPASYSGTRMEGSVDCIAELPKLLETQVSGDSIKIRTTEKGKLIIWKGNPSYQTDSKELEILNDTIIRTTDVFGNYEGKIVLQLIENDRLKDENILIIKRGKPWLITNVTKTNKSLVIHPEMVLVPGASVSLNLNSQEDLIPYPDVAGNTYEIDSFLIDRYPVTNSQYYEFLLNSGYRPSDTARYLKHWQSGIYKQGQGKYPVIYVSYEDVNAYAKWAEKRLPTQAEWQLAAQGTDNRKWPWGDEFHGAYCNNSFNRPTPVDAFPKGQSPYGAIDMVGNVWQMTNDMYFNGSNYFLIIRGGSYYKPDTSLWYLQGGPQSLDKTQILLMVSPGFDRSATVGFRCVKDIESKDFRTKK
jgi:formylglycine-generating enzyme required for sulfatase activity